MFLGEKMEESQEDKIRKLQEFKTDYMHVDNRDKLVLYAVSVIKDLGIEATFEKVAVASFRLFPRAFCLTGFPEYPDARTIYYDVYNHCTLTRGWLSGNIKSGFNLTEKGKYALEEITNELNIKRANNKKELQPVNRKEKFFLDKFQKSVAYELIMKGQNPSEAEIKNAFGLSAIASKDLLMEFISKYKDYAKLLQNSDAIKVIDQILKIVGEKNEQNR